MADLSNIEFTDDNERMYFAKAKLGDDVLTFLNTPVGRYLHGCAKQELELLREEMEGIDPDGRLSFFSRRKLRRLQKKAQAARYFMRWCTEAIMEGEHAFRQLTDPDN